MRFQQALILTFGFYTLSAFAKSTEEQGISTEAILKKELERFEATKKSFDNVNLNVKVIYTYPFKDESEQLMKLDTVEIRPALFYNNPDGPRLKEKYGVERIRQIFAAAKKLNLTAVGSRQVFDTEGVLQEKMITTESLRIDFKDGNTHMMFHDEIEDDDDDDDDDDNVQDYISLLKEFELPLSVEMQIYDKAGEVLKTERATYEPKKVHILKSDMSIPMQMKVAEALKRSYAIKKDPKKRIMLLCRYLGIQYPEYTFDAVIGDGHHDIINDMYIKAKFEGDEYVVSAEIKEEDE